MALDKARAEVDAGSNATCVRTWRGYLAKFSARSAGKKISVQARKSAEETYRADSLVRACGTEVLERCTWNFACEKCGD